MTSIADPDGHLQRAGTAMAVSDLDGVVAHLSAAVRDFTAAGDNRRAAMACAQLGDVFANWMMNRVAAQAWFTRAARLVEHEEPCVEQGWVAVAAMGCEVDDPAVLLERAELALDRARRFGDVHLETKALADGGLAHVQAGRVAEGMAMIDEAMALACASGAERPDSAAKSVCSFFTACYYTADLERVETWRPMLRRRGLIGTGPGPPAFLSSHCDRVQGTLFCHLGRWQEAEDLFVRALAHLEKVMPGVDWHPTIALAELRILQGRLAEAEALLLGRDDHMDALLPLARLHLARGDHELACATARRGLRLLGDDRVRAAVLLGVLVESALQCGDVARAAEASAEMDDRVAGVGLPALSGDAARLRARVLAGQGDTMAAFATLHEALHDLAGVDLPLVKPRMHLDLARLHEAAGDRAAAVVEARAASAMLAGLDIVLAGDDAALLARLDVGLAQRQRVTECRVATLTPDGSWWTVGCSETSVRLRDSKGLRYLAALVSRPGVERQALDLVDGVEGVAAADTGLDRRHLGDAGALLDREARNSYRRRVEELRSAVDDALEREDDDRAAEAQDELDAVVAELARAFGLGGRERRVSSAAEKARLNVTRALRAACAKIVEALPEPGAVLDRRVRTGLYCAYEPHPDDEVVWSVQSPMNDPTAR